MADATSNQSSQVTANVLMDKLSSWTSKTEGKAPLSGKQKESCIQLANATASRLLPTELPKDDSLHPVMALPDGRERNYSGTFAGLEKQKQKIENAQQFFNWFADVEAEMDKEEDAHYRSYQQQLEEYREHCGGVLADVEGALLFLKQLNSQYVFVSTKTNALHEACEQLLADQTKLVHTVETVNSKLAYFNELESISQKLGSPTLTVTRESFIPMLSRLDECIAYITANPQVKESSLYLTKFKLCLSKALYLIKTHVVHLLRAATQLVQPSKVESGLAADNAFTLFYGKFRTTAPRVKSLMEQVEQRLDKSPEYVQILADCHSCYFQQRETLMWPSVQATITDLADKHTRDHCSLVRSGCAFLVHVCEDESQLFFHFFSKPTSQLDVFLEKLCWTLYDVLRPFIIHVIHLETLAELCSILKVEMLEEHVQNNPVELRAFATTAQQLLEDVQERLVYRTHMYMRTDILGYRPAPGDLAYPEKLQMMESIAESLSARRSVSRRDSVSSGASSTSAEVAGITSNNDINGHAPHAVTTPHTDAAAAAVTMSPADLHGMWYPTVRRTLVCLSKLYRCLDNSIFQSLSQEVLHLCIESLITASQLINQRKTKTDGQLFLIKHLLILREQIAPFHVDFAVREMKLDFSKIKDLAFGLLHKKTQMFALNTNNALLEFLVEGTPQVMETYIDSKRDVDNQLKRVCEMFIQDSADLLAGPVKSFMTKADVISMVKQESDRKVNLRQQPFASQEKIQQVAADAYRNLRTQLPLFQHSMNLYLANKDTEFILFHPIRQSVQQSFQEFISIVRDSYEPEEQQIIACPSAEQINLLLSSPYVRPSPQDASQNAARTHDAAPSVNTHGTPGTHGTHGTPGDANHTSPIDEGEGTEGEGVTNDGGTKEGVTNKRGGEKEEVINDVETNGEGVTNKLVGEGEGVTNDVVTEGEGVINNGEGVTSKLTGEGERVDHGLVDEGEAAVIHQVAAADAKSRHNSSRATTVNNNVGTATE